MNTKNAADLSFARRNYRPLLELGRGGMARVFLAESLASGIRKLVVLKILNRELASEPEIRAAFRREAELSAQMNHPNVVQVLEVVEHSGTPVIVMEYLDGIALSAVNAQTHADMPLALHLHILTQVLAGLHHFHELRDFDGRPLDAVHRDVSPQNVMVLHDGPIKVLDFGIAKIQAVDQHTRAGIVKGKLHYMPPEQLLGEATLDRRADLFAVGIMLWEAVAKRRLWSGYSEGGVVRALARGEVPRIRDVVPDVRVEIEAVIERAMEFECSRRFSTAEEMQLELEQAITTIGGFIQARDVSSFMLKHFGEKRQFRRRAIERSLRDPQATLSGVMECVTPRSIDAHSLQLSAASGRHPKSSVEAVQEGANASIDPASDEFIDIHSFSQRYAELSAEDVVEQDAPYTGTGQSSRNLLTDSRTALSSSPTHAPSKDAPPRRSRAAVTVTGLALLAAAGVAGWFVYGPGGPLGSAPVAQTQTVQLQIAAKPADAEILLDGRPLGTGAYRGEHATSPRPAMLEVRAPGYATERRSVQLRQNLSLEVVLAPEAAPPQAEDEPASATSPQATTTASPHSRPKARGARAAVRPPRTPAAAAAPPPSTKPA
ncbi:MAG TPA: serine/threonine-protein kinase, partial [Polyangiaceae bacterium]